MLSFLINADSKDSWLELGSNSNSYHSQNNITRFLLSLSGPDPHVQLHGLVVRVRQVRYEGRGLNILEPFVCQLGHMALSVFKLLLRKSLKQNLEFRRNIQSYNLAYFLMKKGLRNL